ncbi:MAG: DUF2141 domain-containing protein [Pirellulaceae bacterium]|nr:DUF2141 domain-containing protein [Pirellulaceae bacterium]
MLKQIINIWRNNNGSFLFACGLTVVLVMSVLWRFDMIPDLGQSLRASPMMIGGRVTSMPTVVVVSITSEDTATADVHMQVFASPEMINESLSPIETRVTTMKNGLSEFLIMGLARGAYAGIAYVDLNGNGQIDLADDGMPAEPFGFAKVTSPEDSQTLANGVFEVTGDPTFVKIHLKKPRFPVTSSRPTEGVQR